MTAMGMLVLAALAGPPADAADVDIDEPVVTRYVAGEGFGLATKDGKFSLAIRARLQPRFELEHAEHGSTEEILMLRRARLTLQGNLFGRHNGYYIQLGFTPRDMTGGIISDASGPRHNPLRDARIELGRFRDANLWIGQMKVPFSRQRVVSDGNLDGIDRSIANEEFNLDRDIGVQLRSRDLGGLKGRLGYALGMFMGEGRNSFEPRQPGMLWVARFEVRPLGKFDDSSESDLGRSKKVGMAIGAAYAYHDEAEGDHGVFGDRPADRGTTDYHNGTLDFAVHWRGLALESAAHWRVGRRNPGDAALADGTRVPAELARNGVGWFVQLGWLLPRTPLELVGRYAQVRNVYGAKSGIADADEAGGGINYYFAGHNFKLQADYYRLWSDAAGPAERLATDRLRVQLQLAF